MMGDGVAGRGEERCQGYVIKNLVQRLFDEGGKGVGERIA